MLLTPWSQLLHQSWNQLRRRFGRRPAPRPGYRSRSSSVDVLEDRVLLSQLGARWTSTATNGGGLNQGDPTTLTWSIIPDGTPISRAGDIAEEKNSNSDLIKYLDKEVGAGPGGADLTLRPWFSLFFDSFNRLSEVSGLTYKYEPNDDRVAIGSSNSNGVLGKRGDIRVGGHFIDGKNYHTLDLFDWFPSEGVLAYNYYPDGGDRKGEMIIDTGSATYLSPASTYIDSVFRALVMHEAGHGVGLAHVDSSDARFMMETPIEASARGPQIDDILGLQKHYGDPLEKNGGNDSAATATNLGTIAGGNTASRGTSVSSRTQVDRTATDFVSIDGLSDQDYYKFTVSSNSVVSLKLATRGPTYSQGPEDGAQSIFNAALQNTLRVELRDSNDMVMAQSIPGVPSSIGRSASITNFSVAPGTYYARVVGAVNSTQLYSLDVTANAMPSLRINGTSGPDTFHVEIRQGGEVYYSVNDNPPQSSPFGVSSLEVVGLAGDDTLFLDIRGPSLPPDGIRFDGGSGFDSLEVGGAGGMLGFQRVSHWIYPQGEGIIVVVNGDEYRPPITYVGTESIDDGFDVDDRSYFSNGGSETLTLGDDSFGVTNKTTLATSLGQSITFLDPTVSLWVDAFGATGPTLIRLSRLDPAFNAFTEIHGSSYDDTFNVQATTGTTNDFFLFGHEGNDVFNVSSDAGTNTGHLLDLDRPLTVFSGGELGGERDVLNVSELDSARLRASADIVTIGDTIHGFSLSGNAGGGWRVAVADVFQGGINLFTARGSDRIDVYDTRPGEPIKIESNAGSDTVNVGAGGSMATILGPLTVRSTPALLSSETSTLNLDDSANLEARLIPITVTSTVVVGLAPGSVSYAGLDKVVISTGTVNDSIEIESTPDATTLTINAGGGNDTFNVTSVRGRGVTINGEAGSDTFNVSPNARNLSQIESGITVHGGTDSGVDALNLFDQATDAAPTYGLNRNFVSRRVGATVTGQVTFGDLEKFVLNSSDNISLIDTVNVEGTPDTTTVTVNAAAGNDLVNVTHVRGLGVTINSGPGNDTISVSPDDRNLDKIESGITVDGGGNSGDRLIVYDQSAPLLGTQRAYGIDWNGMTRAGGGMITYGNLNQVVINGGGFGNILTVKDTINNASSPVTTLNTGNSVDTVNVERTTGRLIIDGVNGADSVTIGAGTVQTIAGAVNVLNSSGRSKLTVNHSTGPAAAAVIGNGQITGLNGALITYVEANVSDVILNLGLLADTVTVIPGSTTGFSVHANAPTSGTPGDSLNVNLTGTTGATLRTTAPGTGQWTFANNNRQPVSFTGIETQTSGLVLTDGNSAADTVVENAPNGTAVGITALATGSSGITYSLTNNLGNRFAINATTGVVTVANGSLLDFETASSHSITVQASAGALTSNPVTFVIAVSKVAPLSPTDSNPAANSVARNALIGATVGVITASADPAGGNVTYSLTNNAGGLFAISPSSGVVTVANSSLLNSSTAASQTISVQASDGKLNSAPINFTISVTNSNAAPPSAPTDSDSAINRVVENVPNGTTVGLTALSIGRAGSAVSYVLIDNAGGRFAINATTGVVTVGNGGLLNFETAPSHTIIAAARDSSGLTSITTTFTINVTNAAPFAPTDSDTTTNRVVENAASGTTVGLTASATDPAGGTVTYSLIDNAGGRFAINATTGVVTVGNGGLLNFETAPSHTIIAAARDSSGLTSVTTTFTINVTNAAPFAPMDSDTTTNRVVENAASGTTVGLTASATDPAGGTVTYSLIDNAGGRFAINATTGVVTVGNGGLLNFETAPSHTIIAAARDSNGLTSVTTTFTINVTNAAPFAPTDSDTTSNRVVENAASGTTVGLTASATDPAGGTVSYALIDNAGGRFVINATTGVVTVGNGGLLKFKTATAHTIIVAARDSSGLTSLTTTFTINVIELAS